MTDRIRDDALSQIAKTGRCYANEGKMMAAELIALRSSYTSSPTDCAHPETLQVWGVNKCIRCGAPV